LSWRAEEGTTSLSRGSAAAKKSFNLGVVAPVVADEQAAVAQAASGARAAARDKAAAFPPLERFARTATATGAPGDGRLRAEPAGGRGAGRRGPRAEESPGAGGRVADPGGKVVAGATVSGASGSGTTVRSSAPPAQVMPAPSTGQILRRAHDEARRLGEEARQIGFEQGKREGVEIGRQEAVALVTEARQIIEQARSERTQLLADTEPEILRLAMAIARKITRERIEHNPECVVDSVAEALRRVRGEEQVTVRVNPRDAAIIAGRRDDLITMSHGMRRWTVAEDEMIEAGGCVVETARGSIDARVDRQLARIERALTEVMCDGQSGQ
jgi:flagellar assembly protein FliH